MSTSQIWRLLPSVALGAVPTTVGPGSYNVQEFAVNLNR
jgi:hypothetical protein